MFKSKKIKAILMIIIFGAILLAMPNFSQAASSEPNGKLRSETRKYTDLSDGKEKYKRYLLCSEKEGPKCTSNTNWEFHINLTNFTVYVYQKKSGKWKLYATQECAAGRIGDYHGLSITDSCETTISSIKRRGSTQYSSFYYCLWTTTNYAMHSKLYDKDVNKPTGKSNFGKGKYVSGGCIRMETDFVKKLYEKQGNKLIGSKVIAYYTKDCFLFNQANRRSEWATIKGNRYYFNKSGYIVSGPTKIGDKVYYFDLDGTYNKALTGLELRGHKYYFVRKGFVQTGWQTYNNKTYYFWKEDGTNLDVEHKKYQMATGLISLNGKIYYLSKKGVRQTGLKNIDNNKYYFDKKTGVACTGFKKINNKAYYFWKDDGTNSGKKHLKATMATNNISLNGIPYLISSKGVINTGWQTIDGKKYYYNTSTGEAYTGFKTINKKTYYFSPKNGQMAVGLNKIDDELYYFNKKGVRQTGFQTINNKKYYFQSNGIAYVNVTKKINKKRYTFDKNGIII